MPKMTNEEFDSCLLKKKVGFQLIEAARLVLVHGSTIESAASIVGLGKSDLSKVKATTEMMVEANRGK